MLRQLTFLTVSVFTVFCEETWPNIENASFTFDCTGRAIGFYADIDHDCHIFHMCDSEGHRVPHLCANDTGFNQEYRVCDWDNNFDCKDAPKWYFLNELTYATDPPPSDDDDYDYWDYSR